MESNKCDEATSDGLGTSSLPEIRVHEELPTVNDSAFPTQSEVSVVREPSDEVAASQSKVQPRTIAPKATTTPRVVLGSAAFVTSQGLLTPEQRTLRLSIDGSRLRTPQTPVTPSTPSTPGTGGPAFEKTGFTYSWDPAVHEPILPVRCKNVNGELHKAKFGSGGKGKCIKLKNEWYTPSEFEALSGRGTCKDWKRSIRYAGRTIHCLIEDGIVQPHAVTCTCSACCDDAVVHGPVRLFIPYKRRKNKEGEPYSKDEPITPEPSSAPPSPQLKDCVVMLTPVANNLSPAPTFTVSRPSLAKDAITVVAAESVVDLNSELMTPVSQTPTSSTTVDLAEQKQWWHLEEMVNTVINYGQQLKHMLEQTKQNCSSSRELALFQLRNQLEQEKKEAVRQARHESLRSLIGEKEVIVQDGLPSLISAKEVIVQEGLPVDHEGTIKQCANCNRDAYLECAGCHQVSYCSSFCQDKDWKNHHYLECQGSKELIDSDSLTA